MTKRIMIIGSGGAGKSTLARAMGEKLNRQIIHLDVLLWRPPSTYHTYSGLNQLINPAISMNTGSHPVVNKSLTLCSQSSASCPFAKRTMRPTVLFIKSGILGH